MKLIENFLKREKLIFLSKSYKGFQSNNEELNNCLKLTILSY